MSLNEQDREWVRAITRELVFQVSKEVLIEHVKSCPHGLAITRGRAFVAGVAAALTLLGFGGGVAVAKLIPF